LGFCPGSQLQAEVAVPSIGFIWKSDPLNMSKSHFAILGEEINGRYCVLPYMIGCLKQWRIVPCLCDSAVCIRQISGLLATTRSVHRIWILRSGTDNYLAHINIGRRRPIKLATREGIRSKQDPQHG
jgi:hypothetical protein